MKKIFAVKFQYEDEVWEKLIGGITNASAAKKMYNGLFPDCKALSARVCNNKGNGQFVGGLKLIETKHS